MQKLEAQVSHKQNLFPNILCPKFYCSAISFKTFISRAITFPQLSPKLIGPIQPRVDILYIYISVAYDNDNKHTFRYNLLHIHLQNIAKIDSNVEQPNLSQDEKFVFFLRKICSFTIVK